MKLKNTSLGRLRDQLLKIVAVGIVLVVLCEFSFYLGGLVCSEKHEFTTNEITKYVESPERTISTSVEEKFVSFPQCSAELQDHVPCMDPKRWRKYEKHRLIYMERHCPPAFDRKECLVPPPDGYKEPIRWPKSKNECWYRNVPYEWINSQKSNQHWLRKEGEKFYFPGGGTMFPDGVGAYVDLMQNLIPGMKDGTVRTAIDTGCGVASWGGELLDRGILTVSLAPRDNHEAQVQFALERGIPAILGLLATHRLPFPSSSFDMAHCSRCLIPWTEFGGAYLVEIHRILRPGGFWVLSGPPINYEHRAAGWNNTTPEKEKLTCNKLQELLTSMCFKLYNKKDDIAVWQKAINHSCYKQLKLDNYPPICDDAVEPDSGWYIPARPCVNVPNPKYKSPGLQLITKWPERLHVAPERVDNVHGGSPRAFKQDDKRWKVRVKHYKKLLPVLGSDKIRNVMDMNTVYGGFAAALVEDPIWVMNVVSSYAPNTLPVVFDRGLIGTFQDWCEAFSTYPRTYDLLHVDGLFTTESHRCDMKHVLLEMDRILRPKGYAIIRESDNFVEAIATIAKGMRWDCSKEATEDNIEIEKILVCQKKLWYSQKSPL